MHYNNISFLLVLALAITWDGFCIINGEPISVSNPSPGQPPSRSQVSSRWSISSALFSKNNGRRNELLKGLFRLRVFWRDPPPAPPESDSGHHKWMLVARFMHNGETLWPEGEKRDKLAAMNKGRKKNLASANNVHTVRLTEHQDMGSAHGGELHHQEELQPFEYTLEVPGLKSDSFSPWTTPQKKSTKIKEIEIVGKQAQFWWLMMACAGNGQSNVVGSIPSADGNKLFLLNCAKTFIEIGFVEDDGSDLDRKMVEHRHCFSLAEIGKVSSGNSNNAGSKGQTRDSEIGPEHSPLILPSSSSSSMHFVMDNESGGGEGHVQSKDQHPPPPVPTIRLDLVVPNGGEGANACGNPGKK